MMTADLELDATVRIRPVSLVPGVHTIEVGDLTLRVWDPDTAEALAEHLIAMAAMLRAARTARARSA